MRLILDRIEKTQNGKKIAVFEMEDKMIKIDENNMPRGFIDQIEIGDIIEAELDGNKIISAKVLKEETQEKRKEMKSRLSNLFNRKK